jgi:regulator of replication initiation timing
LLSKNIFLIYIQQRFISHPALHCIPAVYIMSDDLEACGVVGAHFDAMPEPDVRRLCSFLLQENTELKIHNNAIQSTLKSLSKENCELKDTISDLHSKAISNHLLAQQNDDLRQTLEGLRIENEILKAENEMLKIKLADYEKRLSAVESRDEPITIREIIRVLESFICLEAAGSKTNSGLLRSNKPACTNDV